MWRLCAACRSERADEYPSLHVIGIEFYSTSRTCTTCDTCKRRRACQTAARAMAGGGAERATPLGARLAGTLAVPIVWLAVTLIMWLAPDAAPAQTALSVAVRVYSNDGGVRPMALPLTETAAPKYPVDMSLSTGETRHEHRGDIIGRAASCVGPGAASRCDAFCSARQAARDCASCTCRACSFCGVPVQALPGSGLVRANGSRRNGGVAARRHGVPPPGPQLKRVAVGVLTQSRETTRWRALEATWVSLFDHLMVFESHTNLARVQQVWKYLPQRLYERFPAADFYLIVDDDVFLNHRLVTDFIQHRDPSEVALYGPGFCDWGVRSEVRRQASKLLDHPMPDFIHMVIGGIMLFTSAAVRRFSEPMVVMRCIDDLETLYGKKILLWGGLKRSALYNQDWLFCWCLQVRMRGKVHIDAAFEDVDFAADKCIPLHTAARERIGIHHADPPRLRALWRAYQRGLASTGNVTVGATDPSRQTKCVQDKYGHPVDEDYPKRRRRPAPPRSTGLRSSGCDSILQSKLLQQRHPECIERMAYVRRKPESSPCYGRHGPSRCAGFQLDVHDACSLQSPAASRRTRVECAAESACASPPMLFVVRAGTTSSARASTSPAPTRGAPARAAIRPTAATSAAARN